MSQDRKDKKMICGLTADERDLLQHELRALPDVMPPRDVWHRIREQAEAEGLVSQRPLRRPMTWYGGVGLAAAVALAAVLVPVMMDTPTPGGITEPPVTQSSTTTQVNTLRALMVESRQLESDLRSLPEQPPAIQDPHSLHCLQ